jgi:hypothetical protein
MRCGFYYVAWEGKGCAGYAKPLRRWRRGSESNRRIKVLQTSPLPLGYRAILNNCTARPDRTESGICDFPIIPLAKTEIPPCRLCHNDFLPEKLRESGMVSPGASEKPLAPGR